MISRRNNHVRLVHTSDIHLAEYTLGSAAKLSERSWRVLKALVDLAVSKEADIIIIAGDLFDHNRIDPATVELALRELLKALVPVIILPGNHDCLIPNSVYQPAYFSKLGPNIRIFTNREGERFSFPELDLAIWGKPIDSYGGDAHPMAGIPPRGAERWQIAVAHGYFASDLTGQFFSFPISQEEITQSGCDYIALGHWETFRCVSNDSVKAYYSGSASDTGIVALVDLLEEGTVDVRPYQLSL